MSPALRQLFNPASFGLQGLPVDGNPNVAFPAPIVCPSLSLSYHQVSMLAIGNIQVPTAHERSPSASRDQIQRVTTAKTLWSRLCTQHLHESGTTRSGSRRTYTTYIRLVFANELVLVLIADDRAKLSLVFRRARLVCQQASDDAAVMPERMRLRFAKLPGYPRLVWWPAPSQALSRLP